MVCSRALGFVLLFLIPLALGNDIENLEEIINKFQEISGFNIKIQYAMAINVQADYCNADAELDFLSQDEEQKVKKALNDKNIYNGNQLIAAKPKIKKKCHSEYRLLRNTTPSHMKVLLDRDAQGCTVFFTTNSPCVEFCSTPDICTSIIPGLEIFKNHTGPKAFVFRQVWFKDKTNNVQLEKNIKTIDEIIPVYKCSEKAQCVRCVENDTVNKVCTAVSDQINNNVYAFKCKRFISLENND